jgi:thiamine-monophosphate kinase
MLSNMDVSESALIDAIHRLLDVPVPEVVVGVGDDAAVLRAGSGDLVLTTDGLVQDRHFELGSIAPRDLGAKAIAVNVSDLAAMAASPRFALSALTVSDRVDAAWVMELFGGIREACDEYALHLVGGNLTMGDEVAIMVTATGEVAPGKAVTRRGAGPGDLIVVTGVLGGAAAGLRLGRRRGGWGEIELAAIRRHVRPIARVGEAAVLARSGASAMIDVSDGLGIDLGRLCRASGVGAAVRLSDLPVDPAATPDEALGGGEDYELVATLPSEASVAAATDELHTTFGVALTRIGYIVAGEGVTVRGPDGMSTSMTEEGWDSFRA